MVQGGGVLIPSAQIRLCRARYCAVRPAKHMEVLEADWPSKHAASNEESHVEARVVAHTMQCRIHLIEPLHEDARLGAEHETKAKIERSTISQRPLIDADYCKSPVRVSNQQPFKLTRSVHIETSAEGRKLVP